MSATTIIVNDETPRRQYTASAGQTVFDFPFPFFENGDLEVYKTPVGQTADDINDILAITTDYTVSGADTQNGGKITLTSGATAGDIITILRVVDIDRTADYQAAGDLLAETLNREQDTEIMISQQLREESERSIRLQKSDVKVDMTLPAQADRKDTVLTFDTDGKPQATNAADFVSGLSGAIIGANYITNNATGDGSTVNFTLSTAPGAKGNLQIYIDGVYQNKASFSLSGTTVTFTEAPPLNASVEFIIGYSIGSATGAASIDFTQAGTGAVTRTVANKLNEFVSVKDFGAVGDGVTDDRAAIQAALDSGAKYITFPTATYKVNTAIALPQTDNMTLDLKGSTIEIDGGYSAFQYIDAGSTSINITSNDMIRGRNYFVCDSTGDASNFTAGDLILVSTTTAWYQDDRSSTYKGELHLVERVSGNVVYIQGILSDIYDTATDTITIQKLNKIDNLHIKDGSIYNNRSAANDGSVSLYSLVNATIENLHLDGHSVLGILAKYWYNGVINNCKVTRSNDSGAGYGIQTSGCTNTKIINSYFNNCRRGVDLSGTYPSHSCSVIGCTAEGSGLDTAGTVMVNNTGNSGFGSHTQSVGGVFKNNTIINCRYGFNARGFDELIQNNVMRGTGLYFVASTFGSNTVIDGNIYYSSEHEQALSSSNDDANRLQGFVLKYLKDGLGTFTVTNNSADRVEQSFIEMYNSNTSGDPFDQIDVTGNTIRFIGGSASEGGTNQVYFLQNNTPATTFELRNSRLINNQVGRISASSSYLLLSSGISVNTTETTSCIVEGLPLSSSTIEVYSGGGTLSGITSNLYADILNGRTHIYGYIAFTLSGGPSLTRINNLPEMIQGEVLRTPIATDSTLWYGGYSGTVSTTEELRLSDAIGTISGTIPDGSYKIAIDYSFRNVVNGYY